MTATNTLLRIDSAGERPVARPPFVVVLAIPRGDSTCTGAVENARSRGAVTITCEVSTSDADFDQAFCAIVTAVETATRTFRGVPVVLVGHGAAVGPARAYAELCPEALDGMVATHPRAA